MDLNLGSLLTEASNAAKEVETTLATKSGLEAQLLTAASDAEAAIAKKTGIEADLTKIAGVVVEGVDVAASASDFLAEIQAYVPESLQPLYDKAVADVNAFAAGANEGKAILVKLGAILPA